MKEFLKRHLGKLALAGVISMIGIGVWAQTNPTVQTTLTGKEYVDIRDPSGATGLSVTTSGLRNTAGWFYSAAVTSGSLVMTANQSVVSLNPSGTIALYTITLPPLPNDGQVVTIFTTQIISTLTIQTSDSATFAPAVPTAGVANTAFSFVYDKANNVWHRFQ